MQTIVTHNGSFDPDDVLAVAALQLYLGIDNTEIIRTRDEEIIAKADWVVDVGREYEPEKNRFDHHQNGLSARASGVPYSSFGLIWKEYGVQIAGSEIAAREIEEHLVLPIDAADNHQTVCHPGLAGVSAFEFFDVVDAVKPVRDSKEDYDTQFLIAVDLGRFLLERMISHAQARVSLRKMIEEKYGSSPKSTIMQFDEPIPRHLFIDYPGVQVVVSPVTAPEVNQWMAAVVPVRRHGFQNRGVFPEAWAGLVDDELSEISGVEGAVFCHKERYIFVAKTREGALKAARHVKW